MKSTHPNREGFKIKMFRNHHPVPLGGVGEEFLALTEAGELMRPAFQVLQLIRRDSACFGRTVPLALFFGPDAALGLNRIVVPFTALCMSKPDIRRSCDKPKAVSTQQNLTQTSLKTKMGAAAVRRLSFFAISFQLLLSKLSPPEAVEVLKCALAAAVNLPGLGSS